MNETTHERLTRELNALYSPGLQGRRSPVKKLDLKGKILDSYPSLTKASKANNIPLSSLHQAVVKRKVKEYAGYIWEM